MACTLAREATVVDLAPQILASILDPEAAAMVQAFFCLTRC